MGQLRLLLSLVIATNILVIASEDSKIRIVTQPERLSKPANTNITLPCTVLNLDNSVVTWSKDGQVISADNFKVLQDNRIVVRHHPGRGVDLHIQGLRVTDTGLYTCTVNINKEVETVVHRLLVEVPPYIESTYPMNGSITVRSGSRVRLECRAGGQPKPTVTWRRLHNQPIHWAENTQQFSNEFLELKNVTREMEGDYVCSAENGVGEAVVQRNININVLYPPEVSGERTWNHAGEGEDITLVCVVYANPSPKVSWYKNTMKLLEGERIHFQTIGNSHKMSLVGVEERDYGEYYCRADNLLEEDVKQKFFVTGKPAQPVVVSDREGRDAHSYDLEWEVRSTLAVSMHELEYWEADKSNSDTVPPRTAHTRRIPGSFSPSHTTSSSSSSFTYNMKGLKNNTFYDVMVRSQNKHGWSPYSSVFTFRTAEKEKILLEIRAASETMRPIYQVVETLKSEPVTSGSARMVVLSSILLLPFLSAVHQAFN